MTPVQLVEPPSATTVISKHLPKISDRFRPDEFINYGCKRVTTVWHGRRMARGRPSWPPVGWDLHYASHTEKLARQTRCVSPRRRPVFQGCSWHLSGNDGRQDRPPKIRSFQICEKCRHRATSGDVRWSWDGRGCREKRSRSGPRIPNTPLMTSTGLGRL